MASLKKTKTMPLDFAVSEYIVYPAHGVGQITAIEEQEVAGYRLKLFVLYFAKDKMYVKVPLAKICSIGMRKLAKSEVIDSALKILEGRAKVRRLMWARRAQEYESKINSGSLESLAEVVRDLFRADSQTEQSYSERQIYELARDRFVREVAVVKGLTEDEALQLIEHRLQSSQARHLALKLADKKPNAMAAC